MFIKAQWFSEVRGFGVFNLYYHCYTNICLTATLFYLAGTLSIAWSSPSLPKLLAPGGPILITVLQGTWILSAMRCALIVVPIPAAWIMERYSNLRRFF